MTATALGATAIVLWWGGMFADNWTVTGALYGAGLICAFLAFHLDNSRG